MQTVSRALILRWLLMFLPSFVFAATPDCSETSGALIPEDPPATAVRADGLDVPDLQVLRDQNRLYFIMPDGKPGPTTIKLPRLANIVQSIRWSTETKPAMQLKPEPTEWSIVLSPPPKGAKQIVVVELDRPAEIFSEETIIEADEDSKIVVLPARHAITRGTNLRFEPQPHKNTVGYWSDIHDTAAWKFRPVEAGTYEIDILQGCGKGHGGSKVQVQVADQSLDFVVEETGHFQNFVWRTLGRVELNEPGPGKSISLKLVPQSKPGGAVMDVRAIRLCPAGIRREFTSELAEPESLPHKFKQ
ncbi:MAG: hypothetical protein KDB01_27755 [Planctomycetaceae bacterium]|nr:hypothetical protein [Planctomycetaceae bacterium]